MSLKEDAQNILGAIPFDDEKTSGRQPTTILDNNVISRTEDLRQKRLREFLLSKPKYYFAKLIHSGPIIEIKEYEYPVFYNWPPPKQHPPSFRDFDENGKKIKNPANEKRALENKKRNAYKSKNKIVRLATINFRREAKFLTLTFKDNVDFDVKNIKECNIRCSNFIRKLSRRYKNFKYIKVIEFQDTFDRGAVHFHILCSLPYVHWSELTKIWGYGGIDIARPKTTSEVSIYISKYMAKYSLDKRFEKHRRFSYSKNLNHPREKFGSSVYRIRRKLHRLGLAPTYEATYDSGNNGKVRYSRYNLEELSARKDES